MKLKKILDRSKKRRDSVFLETEHDYMRILYLTRMTVQNNEKNKDFLINDQGVEVK